LLELSLDDEFRRLIWRRSKAGFPERARNRTQQDPCVCLT